MEIKLIRAGINEAEQLWKMQVQAFQGLYEKYQDTETSPATEKLEKITIRFRQPFTYYYFIEAGGRAVGAVRVIDHKEAGKLKKISPIFILPEYRNRGYAQKAIELAEEIHGASGWELDTILQEKGNCYLYEKMGYRQTGKLKKVNHKLTLAFYQKD